ncbi:MAG: ATP-binding protein [Chitinophagales bacterium]
MLIELSITNYRSIREKVTLSMIADKYDSKSNNVFDYKLPNKKGLRLLNTVLIFGSNGSGKSNIIRAVFDLLYLLKNPTHAGTGIANYNPFKFNSETLNLPSEFQIRFLDKNFIPYLYTVSFNKEQIVSEELLYWPNGRETLAFQRSTNVKEKGIHILNIGKSAQEGREFEKIYSNNFGLSHFSSLTPNKVILNAFNAIQEIFVVNTLNSTHRYGKRNIPELIATSDKFRKKINALIRFADLNIYEIKAEKDLSFQNEVDSESNNGKKKYILLANHEFYNGNKRTKILKSHLFSEESEGSKSVLGLGSEIILALEEGGVLFVDEFETSLHPLLSKALIRIFQNEKLNTKKAQLIFTTHDTNLMDQTIFRRDQIWFSTKNTRGESSLYSMVDFAELREGHAFEKWYLSGKFGALPNLDDIEKAFG